MKLAFVGAVTLGLGLIVGVDGLVLAGGTWILLGPLIRLVATRFVVEPQMSSAEAPLDSAGDGGSRSRPRLTSTGMALSTLLLAVVAVSSLAIGILEIGFSDDDGALRFIPIAVGALAGGIAVLSTVVHAAGAGIQAVVGDPQHPGTVRIEASRETGTYINERPRIEFELLVEPADLPPYRVTKKATVPHTALGNIAVGDGFEALVDPADPDSIAIDWNSPLRGEESDSAERLRRLEELQDQGLIDATEYEEQRRRILNSL